MVKESIRVSHELSLFVNPMTLSDEYTLMQTPTAQKGGMNVNQSLSAFQ